MKRKLGLNVDCIRFNPVPKTDVISMMSDVGFEACFSNMKERSLINEMKRKADSLGIEFEFIHAPYSGSNNIWKEGEECLPLINGIKESIDVAEENGISGIVCHVSSGWHTPPLCDIGFKRFDEIIEHAEKKKIKVAFENVRKLGDHASIMHRYFDNPLVGFCYDSGHEHCYTETVPFIDLYHSKLWYTHLNDNVGRDHNDMEADGDFHYLPFDGTVDFKKMIKQMDKYNFKGSLSLEVFNDTKLEYKELTPLEYIKICFERVKKISEL